MIFVTVGTTYGFDELVKAVDELAISIDEKIIVQTGNSKYIPQNCEYFTFKPNLNQYIKKARLVISHGGAGTSYEILTIGKKLISVENPDVNDSHQWDLLSKLDEEGYIVWCKDIKDLRKLIKKAMTMKFKRYFPPRCEIHHVIQNFLEDKQ
jgi:beta-1,4-N-acetylglucosaminyltransferase